MKIKKSYINGLLIITPNVFSDNRGYFFESFNSEVFRKNGLPTDFMQDNESKSQKGVVRGLHFQSPPMAQGKLVRVIKGSVIDVVVDIRKGSKTYGKWHSELLSGENKKLFWVPPGFAHGFQTLENDTIFSYKCSGLYHKESEGSLFWNDPNIGINWDFSIEPIISEKDKVAPLLSDLESPFIY